MMIRLWFLMVVLICGGLPAGAGVDAVPGLLKAKRYEELDRLYAEVAMGPFLIHEDPDLLKFFTGMLPKESEESEVWEARLAELDEWAAQADGSKAAVLARATFYNAYAQKGRTRNLAKDVTPEGWNQFAERRATAAKLLADNAALLESEIHYHYLMEHIHAPSRETIDISRRHAAIIARMAPGYWPAYDVLATYLEVRWGAAPNELSDYATASADALEGEAGDILYARLMDYAAFSEGENFVELCRPDGPRIKRGYDAALRLAKPGDRRARLRLLAGYAHTMARLKDWRQTRAQLLRMGKVKYFHYWRGWDGYFADLDKSGAWGAIVQAGLLEQQGRLEEAEQAYLAFEPEHAANSWLTDFYLRHGRADDYAKSYGAYDLSRPVEKLPLNDAAELCRVYAALQDLPRAKAVAERFDAARGHNIAGKLVLYYIALAQGDQVAAKGAREAITNLKTNRKNYVQAQALLKNETAYSVDDASTLDWNDAFIYQAVTAIALRQYELGKVKEARGLLRRAVQQCYSVNEREWMNALIFYPPGTVREEAR